MRISFRHGIVLAPTPFLTLSNKQVNLTTQPNNPVIATVADKQANYLITENIPVTAAWVGPFEPGQDYWLYWDIDILTGAITRGYTILAPIQSENEPLQINEDDQHWFNTSTNETRVWNNTGWTRKIRLFAAKLSQGSNFASLSINTPSFLGTQVGNFNTEQNVTGSILCDTISGYGIRRNNGTFITTEDNISTGISSSSIVKFGGIVIEALAKTNLIAYSIVRFSDFNVVEAATNYLIDNSVYGIIDNNYNANEIAQIIIEGVIQNPNWDWSAFPVNTPLYADGTGALTTESTITPIVIAVIVDKHSILLRPSSLYVNTSNDPASITNMGSVLLSMQPDDITLPTAVSINDPSIMSIMPHISDTTIHYSPGMDLQAKTVVANSYSNLLVELPNSQPNAEWDMSYGAIANITLTGDINLLNPLNVPASTIIVLKITQDSVGNHNVTFDTNFKAATVLSASLDPHSTSIFTFISDDIYLYEMSRTIGIM